MAMKVVNIFALFILISSINAMKLDQTFMLDTIAEWQNNTRNQLVKNEKCSDQLEVWWNILAKDVAEDNILLDNWAWRMLDASHKINPGILNGNTLGTGNLDECLLINVMHDHSLEIKGKYCYPGFMIPLPPRSKQNPVISHRQSQAAMPELYYAAVCIPHECLLQDINPITAAINGERFCQTEETFKEWSGGDWAFVAFFLTITVFVIASTLYDWYIRKKNLKPMHPITLAFSFYTNGEKLIKISNSTEQISCLHGVRALSMMWVMAGHRFSIASFNVTNLEQMLEWSKKPYSQYMQGAPLAVDSFLFLSGVLMAYGFMKSQSKPKAKFNIFLFYLHRYLRLTPAVAVLYFFFVTVYKHFSSGPQWPMITNMQVDYCLDSAYTYFLYIQNFMNPDKICMTHTWYLSADMQIFIFSPIILIPMVKYPKHAGYALILLIAISVLPPILITYFKDVVAYGSNYNKDYYFQSYTRISPWLVGVLLGYIIYQFRDKKIKMHPMVNLGMWAFILAGMILNLYFGCDMNLSEDMISFAFYNGLHRMFWAVGLMWIVFACHTGYGGLINWFLSLPPFEIIGKISYSMYLLHALLQTMNVSSKRTPVNFTDYEVLSQCFADIISVSTLALFYCLLFESPMVVVEKIIFGAGGGTKPKPKTITEAIDSPIEPTTSDVDKLS